MELIHIHRKRNKNKIDKNEFNISKMLLDYFEADYGDDFEITYNYSPIYCGEKILAYTEHFSDINSDLIPKDKSIFRPLINERHANILIEMFEELGLNDLYCINIEEFINKNGKKKYRGYFVDSKDNIIKSTYIKSSSTIPILKTSMVAKAIFNDNDFYLYRSYLKDFLYHEKSGGEKTDNDRTNEGTT